MAWSGISSLANHPYRFPPTIDMGSYGLLSIVWCMTGTLLPSGKISKSTARKPLPSSWNVCRNVYQPEVVITTGGLQVFCGGVAGFGHGKCGLAPPRNAFVLVWIMKCGLGPGSPGSCVDTLKTKSLRNVPSVLLIAELQSNRTSLWPAAQLTSR